MYIAILGRQPAISIAELERCFGSDAVRWFSDQSALIETDALSVDVLGGTQKAGRVVAELSNSDWRAASTKIVQAYTKAWSGHEGKLTLGISAYGFDAPAREVQKTGIILKQTLKKSGVSLRLIPNTDPQLNTATSHHNKLGLADNKVELLVVRARDGRVIIAESIGAQNISALARRDQGRPKRDAFVGMLPPKLARIIVNLAVGEANPLYGGVLLDPFCGTGVILQEASLRGFDIYGSDLSDKMIEYTDKNLMWLLDQPYSPVSQALKDKADPNWRYFTLEQGDATSHRWKYAPQFVATEAYLGQPFSAPPSPEKLKQVQKNCDHIISGFLKNIAGQIKPGTPLCVAVPTWRDTKGKFTHLPLIKNIEQLGFVQYQFKNIQSGDLLYYREGQVVARELLVLSKS